MKTPRPPQRARKIFEWFSGPARIDDLLGDLDELFYHHLKTKSAARATRIYWKQVFQLMLSYALRKRKKDASPSQFSSSTISLGMLQSYVKVASRNLYQQKYFTVLNAFGLAMGMSISLLLISMYSYISTYDNFHTNKDHIYTVTTHRTEGIDERYLSSSPVALAEKLRDYTGVKEVVRIYRSFGGEALLEKENLRIQGYYADSNFLQVFSFPLVSGHTASALKEPNSIVLTEEVALKFFRSTDVLGKVITFKDLGSFEITGILKNLPKNTHFKFDVLTSYSSLPSDFLTSDHSWQEYSQQYLYVLLEDPSRAEEVNRYMKRATGTHYQQTPVKVSFELQHLSDITTSEAYQGIGVKWETSGFIIFGVIALLILLPACFNYTNISIARALKRSKEIGLRKTMGGVRGQIFFQFITETVVVCFISLVGALGIFVLMRSEFQSMMVAASSLDLSISLRMAGLFFAFTLATGFLAGFFPALYFAGLNPIQALKSKPSGKSRSMRIRKGLTVLQFALSFCFILSLVLFGRQYRTHLNFDFGFEKENIVNITLKDIDPATLKAELSRLAPVRSVSLSSGLPGLSVSQAWLQNQHNDSIETSQLFVDADFLKNFKIEIVAGKNFPVEANNREQFMLVNEQFLAANKMSAGDVLGKVFTVEGQELQVIGVVKNFHFAPPQIPIGNFVFRTNRQQFAYANLVMDVSDPIIAFGEIEAVWRKLNNREPMQATFFEDDLNDSFSVYRSLLKIAGFLGVMAITISILGLLGMVVYTSEMRIKEISIRKVLGASAIGITMLLSKDYLKLLAWAILLGIPIAVFVYQTIFTKIPAYQTDLTVWDVLLSGGGLILLGLLTITSRTYRTALSNPAETLKTE